MYNCLPARRRSSHFAYLVCKPRDQPRPRISISTTLSGAALPSSFLAVILIVMGLPFLGSCDSTLADNENAGVASSGACCTSGASPLVPCQQIGKVLHQQTCHLSACAVIGLLALCAAGEEKRDGAVGTLVPFSKRASDVQR
jgi:hypothetical protein